MTKNWADPEAKAEAQRYDNPIPSRTLILTTLEQLQTAQSHAELVDHFNIPDQKSALNHRLSAMVRDGQLMKDGFKYQPATDLPSHEATVYINSKGLGTANISGQDDILLPERELRLVFNGDRVKVWRSAGFICKCADSADTYPGGHEMLAQRSRRSGEKPGGGAL